MRRKGLFGVIAVLIVLVSLSPLLMGYWLKRFVAKDIKVANAQSSGVSIKLVNYNMGWLRSSADLEVTLTDPEAARLFSTSLPLRVKLHLQHGPWAAHDGKRFWGRGIEVVSLTSPLQINSVCHVAFNGGQTCHVNVAALHRSRAGRRIKWDGAKWQITRTSGYKHLMLKATILPILVQEGRMLLQMDAAHMKSDSLRSEKFPKLYQQGLSTMSLPHFQIRIPRVLKLDSRGMDIRSTQQLTANKVGGTLTWDWQSLRFTVGDKAPQKYGPAHLSMKVSDIDAASFNALVAMAQKMNQQGMSLAQLQMHSMMLTPAILKGMSKGFKLSIPAFSLRTPQGILKMTGQASLPSQTGEALNPAVLKQQLTADATVSLPKALVSNVFMQKVRGQARRQLMRQYRQALRRQRHALEPQNKSENAAAVHPQPKPIPRVTRHQITQQATRLMQKRLAILEASGILKLQGKNYTIKLHLADGKLTANGRHIK